MLAPAGNHIYLLGDEQSPLAFTGYQPVFLNSGTASLALAIKIAKQKKPVGKPEIIIPAYACPDLVAAAAFNNVKCRLCDLEQNQTGYSLPALSELINENTIAIVSVNFLGIQEKNTDIQKLTTEHDIILIEDNAQWYPELSSDLTLDGDCIVISFGRGKPVSLLGGGCLLVKDALLTNPDIKNLANEFHANLQEPIFKYYLKVIAYNALINPACYSLLKFIPGLKLGQTVYKQLHEIQAIDTTRKCLLEKNISQYTNSEPAAQLYLQTTLTDDNLDYINLPIKLMDRCKRLLRYPLLLEDEHSRNNVLEKLNQAGLGATALYNTTLPEIPGVETHLAQYDDLPNASDFASRLITLPVHEYVQTRHLDRMIEILIHH